MLIVMRNLALLLGVIVMAGCELGQQTADGLARESARVAVNEVLITQFPNVDRGSVTSYTNCIIDNASAREIGRFAQAAVVGVDADTVSAVLDIATRQGTVSCFVQSGLLVRF